jgi:Fic family protein
MQGEGYAKEKDFVMHTNIQDAQELRDSYYAILDWWSELDDAARRSELKDFAMEFAYHSAKVERADVTYEEAREIFESGTVTAYTGDLRSLVSVRNQQLAYEEYLANAEDVVPLDEELVLACHFTLTYGTFSKKQLDDGEFPGTYKLSDYFVRETHEVGAPVEDCPRLVRDLCDEVNGVIETLTPKEALTCAAYFHNQLVRIHPFSEGTGRVARELANLILILGGHPPVIVFEEDKPEYFRQLEMFDDTGDLKPFKRFLRRECVRSWHERVR